ncbi:ACSF2-like protein [Mya arenaria]|uniref:ACSF2-like protein n=1 Tax=Mya arenaria TaxID=6604 RepID=A0ABY7EZC1_MYAAR|nr:ACSF2-like protein [Mya arenaria]
MTINNAKQREKKLAERGFEPTTYRPHDCRSKSAQYERNVVTWRQLHENSFNVARALLKLGLRKGECVAINLRSCPEWVYLTFGCMVAGLRPACLSFTYTDGSDVVATMERLQTCALLVMDPGENGEKWSVLEPLLDSHSNDASAKSSRMPYLRYLLGHEDSTNILSNVKNLTDLLYTDSSDMTLPEISEDDIALLLQTSGSTGVPKLAAHTHRSILTPRYLHPETIMFDRSLRVYCDRPFTWVGGFPFQVLTGQTRVTTSGFASSGADLMDATVQIIQRERCTLMYVLPPFLHEMIRRKDKIPSDWPLRYILTGGQPITRGAVQCIGPLCDSVVCAYGGTEFIICGLGVVTDIENFVEFSCGKVITGPGFEFKIVDKGGKVVPMNERGEIFIRSLVIFKEYYNDPEKTKEVFTDDGWYKTDDLGRMTSDGNIFVEGRKSNMIISGGMNVAPEILERVLRNCPGVGAAALVPVPDPVFYQVVCAYVIKQDGSDLTEETLRRFCEDYHNDRPGVFTVLPTFYMFLDEFPLLLSGKLSRKDLNKLAQERVMPALK